MASPCLPILVAVATVTLAMVATTQGQFYQPQLSSDLVQNKAVIVMSGNCSTCSIRPKQCYDLQACRLTCNSGRNATPPPDWLLGEDQSSGCPSSGQRPPLPSSLPSHVNVTNYWHSNGSNPCQINQTVSSKPSNNYFTLSFWLRGSCSSKCALVGLGTGASPRSVLNLSLDNTSLEINGNKLTNWPQVGDTWTHVLIRKSAKNELFVRGSSQTFPNLVLTNGSIMNLTLGSSSNYSGSVNVYIVDVRFYKEALTNREVAELYSGTLDTSVPYPDCFCPDTKPELDATGFLCGDGSSQTEKFSATLLPPSVTVDGDASTAWIGSGSISLEVDLGRVYQLDSLVVTFGGSSTVAPTLSTKYLNSWRNFTSSCQGQTCTAIVSTSTTPSNRSGLERYLGSAIRVTLLVSSNNLLAIKELQLNGMSNCFGNARSFDTTLSKCACLSNTNTKGNQCENCTSNFYREPEDFACMKTCDCNPAGVKNTSDPCTEVSGTCVCKPNVEGARCDQCKHLTYNLQANNRDGCQSCPCDADGTVSCHNTTGACTCKANVQPGSCSTCRAGYYGRENQDGCRSCDCNTNGTNGQSSDCNGDTGQCDCKPNVMGRQCDQCKGGFWNLDRISSVGCKECACNDVGRLSINCNTTTGQCPCRGEVTPNRECAPVITEMTPAFGPLYGGTKVTMSGWLLGGKTPGLTVFVDGKNTSQEEMSDERVVFATPSSTSSGAKQIRLNWKGSSYEPPGPFTFEYRTNPSVTPSAQTAPLISYASGGCRFPVNGANLNSVAKPVVIARAASDPSISNSMQMCEYLSTSGSLQCRTPSLKGSPYNSSSLFNLSLAMDSMTFDLQAQVEVVEDPYVYVAEALFVEFPFTQSVTIRGRRLKQACSSQDLQVLVGDKECRVLHHTDTEITCEPPDLQGTSERTLNVTVSLGFSQHAAGTLEYRPFWKTMYFIYIVIGVAALILIVILIISITCYCRRRRRRNSKNIDFPLDDRMPAENNAYSDDPVGRDQSNGSTSEPASRNPLNALTLTRPQSKVVDTEAFLNSLEHDVRIEVKTCLYIRSQFAPGQRCTKKGENFRVIDGEMTEKPIKLMIKTLVQPLPEEGSVPPWALTALRECLRFRGEGGEDGVLGMLGVGLDEHRFYVLYPASQHQSLRDHIQDTRQSFTMAQLLELGVQISEAMDYLSTKGLVHRDLATRNCCVTENSQVLVTDGAGGSDLYPADYVFDSVRGRHLPVRWMAPECLSSGFYDTKSDVWSFGVVLWELFTRGLLPYTQVADAEVERCVMDGYRLQSPDVVSEPLYQLMVKCWESDSNQRPSFLAINQSLDTFLKGSSCTVEENFYMNQAEVR